VQLQAGEGTLRTVIVGGGLGLCSTQQDRGQRGAVRPKKLHSPDLSENREEMARR
jgi:hypothetical protein